MNTNQILIQQYIHSLGSTNQWIISNRNNKTTIVNTYSLDQFLPYRFVQNHGKLFKEFKLRHLYTLPNTPKIILIPNILKLNKQMLLLAQRGQFQFPKLINKCHGNYKSQLELILQIVNTVSMLHKKYGFFQLTSAMIRASKGPSLLIWINEDQVNNYPQFPIGPLYPVNLQKVVQRDRKKDKINDDPMYIMTVSLLQILSQKIPNNSLINQLLKEKSSQNINFQFVKKKIQQAIKDQFGSLCSISSTLSIEKSKTFTEEKKKKIPQFLLNKGNYSNTKKQKQKHADHVGNKKSMLSYLSSQNNDEFKTNDECINKQMENKLAKDQFNKTKYMFSRKGKNKSKTFIQNQDSFLCHCKLNQEQFMFCNPAKNSPKQNQIKLKKDDKSVVRDSGKTSSTATVNYLSVNSSGKKSHQNNFSIDVNESCGGSTTLLKTNQKKIGLTFGQISPKSQQQTRSIFYKQNTNKLSIKISNIIEQNQQQQFRNELTIKNPKSSIFSTVVNNKSSLMITQKSIVSPGSEFYNDVDVLLYSGVLNENKNNSDDLDRSLEKQLHKILFD